MTGWSCSPNNPFEPPQLDKGMLGTIKTPLKAELYRWCDKWPEFSCNLLSENQNAYLPLLFSIYRQVVTILIKHGKLHIMCVTGNNDDQFKLTSIISRKVECWLRQYKFVWKGIVFNYLYKFCQDLWSPSDLSSWTRLHICRVLCPCL